MARGGTATSIFKGGSTVPAKLQLKRVDGTIVQPTSTRSGWARSRATPWHQLRPSTRGSTTIRPAGRNFRWDPTASQDIYNWSTKGFPSGYFHRGGPDTWRRQDLPGEHRPPL